MKKIIALLALSLLFSACLHDDREADPVPFQTSGYVQDMKPGDNQLMLRTYAYVQTRDLIRARDTILGADTIRVHDTVPSTYRILRYALEKIEMEKDTVILNGSAGSLFTVTRWDISADSIRETEGRKLIVQESNFLNEYVFKGSSVGTGSLLKASAYDSSAFSDKILQAVFPLTTGMVWSIRPEKTSWGYMPVQREYKGEGTCGFGLKRYECGVFVTRRYGGEEWAWVTLIGTLFSIVRYMEPPQDSIDVPGAMRLIEEEYKLLVLNAPEAQIKSLRKEYQAISAADTGVLVDSY